MCIAQLNYLGHCNVIHSSQIIIKLLTPCQLSLSSLPWDLSGLVFTLFDWNACYRRRAPRGLQSKSANI